MSGNGAMCKEKGEVLTILGITITILNAWIDTKNVLKVLHRFCFIHILNYEWSWFLRKVMVQFIAQCKRAPVHWILWNMWTWGLVHLSAEQSVFLATQWISSSGALSWPGAMTSISIGGRPQVLICQQLNTRKRSQHTHELSTQYPFLGWSVYVERGDRFWY